MASGRFTKEELAKQKHIEGLAKRYGGPDKNKFKAAATAIINTVGYNNINK